MVVAWSRVILGFLGVVDWGSVRGCVIFGLFGVVLGSLGVVARWSVSCGVVNWSLGVVAGCRVVLGSLGVVSWGIRSRVVLR